MLILYFGMEKFIDKKITQNINNIMSDFLISKKKLICF